MTIEALKKRIKTTNDLRDIVSTMKMLSSVSIAPYEKAMKSLDECTKIIEDAFVGLMKDEDFFYNPKKVQSKETIAIVIGTDNGLVGRFNRDILNFTKKDLKEEGYFETTSFITLGKRVGLLAESGKLPVVGSYAILNSVKEIPSLATLILTKVNEVIAKKKASKVLLYYMRKKQGEIQKPIKTQLMPLPLEEMIEFKKRKWDGRSIPLITSDKDDLFKALIREYLTACLTKAITASLAAEHYTRMVNMQQAEKNIDDNLTDMNLAYQQLRQTSITDELIDIVSGAETLKK